MQMRSLIVYADMNCPFCFALHERLLALGRIEQIDWRSIEHAPHIKFDKTDLHTYAELTREIKQLNLVAPDIAIHIPTSRPNSHNAIMSICEAQEIDSSKAIHYRTLVYRALWLDGADISHPALLSQLRSDAGLPPRANSDLAQSLVQQWQQEWEQGEFARTTPSLVTPNSNKILGLPASDVIEALLSGSLPADIDEGAFCYIKPKEKILIAVANPVYARDLTNSLSSFYQLSTVTTGMAAYAECISDHPPDLLLMDVGIENPGGFLATLKIKDNERCQNLPVILLSDKNDVATEVKAFDVGAIQYIVMPCASEILRARVRVLLRLKRTTDLLEQFSRLDGLTEIPNRREFDRLFEREWLRAKRMKKPLSLILLDVDYFKLYNDNYGHMEGDQCLKKIADILERSIRRPPDVVARYGGEEFVIILPETDKQGALQVAKKIKDKLNNAAIPHAHSRITNHITCSQGVASLIPSVSLVARNLIDAADIALYKAKDAGRNQIVFGDIAQD